MKNPISDHDSEKLPLKVRAIERRNRRYSGNVLLLMILVY